MGSLLFFIYFYRWAYIQRHWNLGNKTVEKQNGTKQWNTTKDNQVEHKKKQTIHETTKQNPRSEGHKTPKQKENQRTQPPEGEPEG